MIEVNPNQNQLRCNVLTSADCAVHGLAHACANRSSIPASDKRIFWVARLQVLSDLAMLAVAKSVLDSSYHVVGLLSTSAASAIARPLPCSAFLVSDVTKQIDFACAVAGVRGLRSIKPTALIAAIIILNQFVGSPLVIPCGCKTMIGASLLAGFTLVATVLAHTFWSKTGKRALATTTSFEHFGIVGGVALAAILATGSAK